MAPKFGKLENVGQNRRIGFLGSRHLLQFFRTALANLGYVEGQNLIIESRWPPENRLDLLAIAAAELVSLKVDVIAAGGGTAARAAKGATTDIPIVFALVFHPAEAGLVANLERPNSNVTGFTTFDPQQARKQLEILKDVIPGLARVTLLGDAAATPALFHENEDAARALGLQTQTVKVARTPNPDFVGALEQAKNEGTGAVVVISTPVTTPNRRRIAELAIKHRLPTLSPRDHADSGALISYGTGFSEPIRGAAVYVDKIFEGAKPGDLPVGTARQHELIINLKTAREIGVTVPPAILRRANQVIQ
jgi:putative tryptophan/tyrosine transport system substrate-binding protein